MVHPRSGALLHHVGLHHPADGLHRGLRVAVPAELPHPDHRAMGRAGLPAGLLRHGGLPRYRHLRGHPYSAQPARDRPVVAVLRLPCRRRLVDPVHDLQRHLDLRAGPRVRGQQRHAPLRQGRIPLTDIRHDPASAWPHRQRSSGNRGPAVAHRRHARVPDHRAALQAPAHLPGADQRHVQAAARRVGSAAAGRGRRQTDRLRKPARRRRIRPRQDRRLHLEGHARLRHLYRMWALPVAMPGLEHWMAKAPYLLGEKTAEPFEGLDMETVHEEGHHVPESGFGRVPGHGPEQAARPLVGTAEQGGVIDPDVLWSCVNCGACVEQCPVDIEHIDHIVDLRRYQVMMKSEFPSELSVLFKNLENKGNPWGQNASDRTNWIDEVDFDVPVYGEDVDSFDGYEYLFWVGCAGAYDDKAKKTTKAVAELLAIAGVKYLVLGTGETCNGDSARRSGNEFLFQQLAQQAVETLDGVFEGVETVDRKIVVSCPHCFNTIGKEYRQLGANYTVLHHTQLLNRLVRDKKLVPVSPVSEDITYHDPCFLGRHNKVYEAPRELIGAAGAKLTEMPRHADRSFCCGAGGARMWMEEHIGKRINHERVDEALATGATTVATACPFCRVMVTDGVNDRQEAAGREGV